MSNNINRQSNIELLRIISMFMVMALHAIIAIGYPEINNTTSGMENFISGFVKALCIVAVNVFVMISGWFGIYFSYKRLIKFLFQVLFFSLIGYIISIFFKVNTFLLSDFLSQGLMLSSRHYWFVRCYLLLFVLSPILNQYCEKVQQRNFRATILILLSIQTIAAWVLPTLQKEFSGGYSVISFIILYLIARYVKIYAPKWSLLRIRYDISIYVILSVIISIIAYYTHGGTISFADIYSYTSPLVIVSALFLLLAFTKFVFYNNTINSIAASSFAVYLLHEHMSIRQPLYREFIEKMYFAESPYISGFCDILIFIICVYIIAITIDKIRLMVSKLILKN